MSAKTEQMLDKGFGGWDYIRPEFVAELRSFQAQDPQFFADLQALMKRAQAGTCRRKIKDNGVHDDGDWDSPMASSNLDIGELRLPKTDLGWLVRTYVSACRQSPGVMVALLVGDKAANGLDRLNETQNEHIDEAGSRLVRRETEWCD
ncbi:hypothetical protein G6031_09435 [Dietzia sp. CQ4]|uniref:hypothetical protein n=1 Tax=Dietzia sp. (strain CQ4) TaxID=370437 RepID=UPI0015FAC37A|nr:hypothetical protein [Dietzia sp. CQ4]MBB1034609.1 hypothetical protein [Dietzia sp. CQ4]